MINIVQNSYGYNHTFKCLPMDSVKPEPAVNVLTLIQQKPLTRKQLIDMLADVIDSDDKTFIKFARAVEAAHGITKGKP